MSDKIAVIGLGYVGLPLAVEFGKKIETVGFDINVDRIAELHKGIDRTLETSKDDLASATKLSLTSAPDDIAECNIYIVTVPTPVDISKQPNLTPIRKASEMLAPFVKSGDIVIYESTVFPGCTANICVPILENGSGLTHNKDFYTGYSPERINSTEDAARKIDALYGSIITAGTFKASSIEVAEAAKVIENTQRDVNIALMNELSIIFNRLNIDTKEVLEAAGTKWNFLPFSPGLVGGHCIGVDPYYLTYRAQQVGYHPEVILAGRRINDSMGGYVADMVAKKMMQKSISVVGSKILVMGLTFKENCPDLRNSKVFDVINQLKSYNVQVDIHDPWVDPEEAKSFYDIDLVDITDIKNSYDSVIVAIGHNQFIEMGAENIRKLCKTNSVLFDLKSIFDKSVSEGRL